MGNRNFQSETGAITQPVSNFSDYERGWITALIDSEGCIGHYFDKRRATWYWKLEIGNTNLGILQKAQSLIGGYINAGTARKFQCFSLFLYRRAELFNLLSRIVLIQKETKRAEFLKEYLQIGA